MSRTAVWMVASFVLLLAACDSKGSSRTTRLEYEASHPLCISADGAQLVTAAGSQVFTLDVSRLSKEGGLGSDVGSTTYLRLEVADVAITRDGTMVAAGGFGTIHVSGGTKHTSGGGISKGGTIRDLEPQGMIWTLDFSPDGRFLATSLGVYDTTSWQLVLRFAPDKRPSSSPPPKPARGPDAKAAAAAPDAGGAAGANDAGGAPAAAGGALAADAGTTGPGVALKAPKPLFYSSELVQLVRFSPDGKRLYVIGAEPGDGRALVVETGTWSVKADLPFKGTGAIQNSLAISASAVLALASSSDTAVALYQLDDKALRPMGKVDLQDTVQAVAFSPDGGRLAVFGHSKLAIAQVSGKSPTKTSTYRQMSGDAEPGVVNVLWHPSGKWLIATRTDNSLHLFDPSKP